MANHTVTPWVRAITHTQEGRHGPQQAELLVGEGADRGRVMIGHMDGNTDPDYHRETLEHGVNIAFDRIGLQGLVGTPMNTDRLRVLEALVGGSRRAHPAVARHHLAVAGPPAPDAQGYFASHQGLAPHPPDGRHPARTAAARHFTGADRPDDGKNPRTRLWLSGVEVTRSARWAGAMPQPAQSLQTAEDRGGVHTHFQNLGGRRVTAQKSAQLVDAAPQP
ncbi:hypothetical protein [Deinococcus saxicola]|uniref:phosphotriesterase family protein n=1 Tax=Deinococcus saxicola TaxID=249406 RepID=UPI003D0CFDE5